MKHLILSLLLVLPAAQGWAQTETTEPVIEEESAVVIQIGDTDELSEEELDEKRAKVERAIDKLITKVNEAVDDELITLDEQDRGELAEAILEAAEESNHEAHRGDSDDTNFMEAMIPITAILLIFGSPLVIVALVLRSGAKKRQLMHDTIGKYIDSGQEVPEDVLKSMEAAPKSQLHSGMVTLAWGLGIGAAFLVAGSTTAAAFGLIFLFIGAAKLLIWKLENKQNDAV
jgi:hypothetical protein